MRAEDMCTISDAIEYQGHMLSIAKTDMQKAQHEYAKIQLVALAHKLCRGEEYCLVMTGVKKKEYVPRIY